MPDFLAILTIPSQKPIIPISPIEISTAFWLALSNSSIAISNLPLIIAHIKEPLFCSSSDDNTINLYDASKNFKLGALADLILSFASSMLIISASFLLLSRLSAAEIIKGSALAHKEYGVSITLTGDKEKIETKV